MNDVQKKDSMPVKILAIIGFSATILFLAWLLIVTITGSPSLFASLASIVAEKEAYQEEMTDEQEVTDFTIASEKSVVNTGEEFQVSWTPVPENGSYIFSFACVGENPITLFVNDTPTRCNEPVSLDATDNEVTLSVNTTKERFTELPLRVAYLNEEEVIVDDATLVITLINTKIAVNATEEVAGESTSEESVEETEPTDEEGVVETPVVTNPVVTQPIQYVYPTSNPDGYIDLSISIQSIVGNTVILDIANIGTKTSSNWSFIVNTPMGTVHNSPLELPLKPKEHAVFTLTNVNHSNGLVATVTTERDTNLINNSIVR